MSFPFIIINNYWYTGVGARSMTGGAGQLIVNMSKTGCYYYYI